ncbi:MAG: C10 family peptidase, partial [Muribaculaceae bacterium]|nr:C10 family peptidase [Muribaculaceae bacterium]
MYSLWGTYKYPNEYAGYIFNWSEMIAKPTATSCTADAQNQIARLMEQLGSSQNLSANYGLNATGAPMHRIPRTLENFGYSNGGSYLPYDTTAVVNELSTGHPVLVEG